MMPHNKASGSEGLSDEQINELAMRCCGVLHGDVLHMDRRQRIEFARRVLAASTPSGSEGAGTTPQDQAIFDKVADRYQRERTACPVDRDELARLKQCADGSFGATQAYMEALERALGVTPLQAPSDETLMELAREDCENFRWPSTALSIMRKAIAAVGVKERPAIDADTLTVVRRYLNDVMAEGTPNEQAVARTVSRMLAEPPTRTSP